MRSALSPSSSGLSPVIPGLDSDKLVGGVQGSSRDLLGNELEIRRRVIKDLENSLLTVGTGEDHCNKIVTLLRLISLCTNDTHYDMRQAQEAYFYRAVTIGRRYLSERLWADTLGIAIFSAYTRYIAPGIQPFHLSEPFFVQLAYTGIVQEAEKRRKFLLEEAAITDIYLKGITDYNDIIRKIEAVFGPIRLLIVSEESGEPTTIHRVEAKKIKSIRKSAREYEYTLIVDILGQSRKYRVIIDYGTSEDQNRLKPSHIDTIINPMLIRHIEQKENAIISYANDYRKLTEKVEGTMEMPQETNNYTRFIEMIMGDTRDISIPAEVRDNPEYAKECHQALDLARLLTLAYANQDNSSEDIIASIDAILAGEITRNVLDMTRAILISRAEMMSGSGYPYGETKSDIPLEARIHTIIRSYEALCVEENNDPDKIRIRMNEWNQGGFFDAHLFSIFMKLLEQGGFTPEKAVYIPIGAIPPARKQYYQEFLNDYGEIGGLLEKIEEAYLSFHNAADNISERSRLAIIINDLQDLLIKKDQSPKIFAVIGHGESPSDLIPGQPGDPDEGLTLRGRKSSDEKGGRFRYMSITFFASRFRRARETAERMTKIVSGKIRKIILVEGLQNPRKDLPNIRGKAEIGKFLADHPYGILNFLRRIVFSPRESVNAVVAHGTTISYLLGILENLDSKDGFRMKKYDIDENAIELRFVRGGRVVEWDLVFPFEDWRLVLDEVNTICVEIFGEEFFVRGQGKIHHNYLHKKFLDYMDRKMEESSEKVLEFLKGLDEGKHTKHFRSMLGKSDLANKKLL